MRLLTIMLGILMMATLTESAPAAMPPKAQKIKHGTTVCGVELEDNYYWLRDKTKPEVIDYLEKENAYTDSMMKDSKDLEDKIYSEIISRMIENDSTVPVKKGEYYYYSRYLKGSQYPLNCRKLDLHSDREEILLDQNALAAGKSYFRIGSFKVSPDGNFLAYTVDTSGNELYTLYIKELPSGNLKSDYIPNVYTDLEWCADNICIFYSTLSEIQQANKIWIHQMDSPVENDKMLYEEKDAQYFISLGKTKDEKYIVLTIESKDESEVWYRNSDDANGKFNLIRGREPKVKYSVESHSEDFFIVTNDKALNYKIVSAPVANPSKEFWKDFLPYKEEVKIESVEPFRDFLVIHTRENGYCCLKIYNFQTRELNKIEFPEPVYTYSSSDYPDYNGNLLRYVYYSPVTPATTIDYELATGVAAIRKTQEVPNYDKSKYETRRIFAKSKDGAKIPVSIVCRKGTKLNGKNPALLYGYGAYGYSSDPYFSSSIFSLIDRGFVYAIAHVRGGGEMGEIWYENGKMLHKMNTFNDFIAAGEQLAKDKYTSKSKLAIMGKSAGGLLVGAALMLKPDLFAAVVAGVPFVDVLNTMLDESIPLTVAEYSEWGNPHEKVYFDYIKSYAPYENVRKTNYPNILLTGGLNDPRVPYWEPAKLCAKLRDMKTNKNLLLLKTNMGAGHGGASGRYEHLKEIAFEYCFILKCLGIK